MSLLTLYSFIIYSIVISITSGPNNIMLTASGLNFGLGIGLGFGMLFYGHTWGNDYNP